MTAEELVERVKRLRVYRIKGQPALYQPITLLWAIGRARVGESRLLPWPDMERDLRLLLVRHGIHGERGRPDYPVAALHRAGLWELTDHHGAVPVAHGDAELRRWFSENQPIGGLPEPIYSLMQESGTARTAVVDTILETYLDGMDHEGLLQDVRLAGP